MNSNIKQLLNEIDNENQIVEEAMMEQPTNNILIIVGTGHRINRYPDGQGSKPVPQFDKAEVQAMREAFAKRILEAKAEYDEVIYFNGHAHGFDTLSRQIAEKVLGKDNVKSRHPNYYTPGQEAWELFGDNAGFWRNHRMLEEAQKLAAKKGAQIECLAWIAKDKFSGSRHCAQAAIKKNIKAVCLMRGTELALEDIEAPAVKVAQ